MVPPPRPRHYYEIVFRISVTASGLDRFLTVSPLVVEEGGVVAITTRNLNTTAALAFLRDHQRRSGAVLIQHLSVRMRVASVPDHGRLLLGGRPINADKDDFYQKDVDSGFVSYQHDHSDWRSDSFAVAVWLETGSSRHEDMLLHTAQINVTVLPFNDKVLNVQLAHSFISSNYIVLILYYTLSPAVSFAD